MQRCLNEHSQAVEASGPDYRADGGSSQAAGGQGQARGAWLGRRQEGRAGWPLRGGGRRRKERRRREKGKRQIHSYITNKGDKGEAGLKKLY